MEFQVAFSDNGTDTTWVPELPGTYVLLIGTTDGANFGGGSISVSQDGIAYTGLTSVSSALRTEITCRGGQAVSFTLSAATSPDLVIIPFLKDRFNNS